MIPCRFYQSVNHYERFKVLYYRDLTLPFLPIDGMQIHSLLGHADEDWFEDCSWVVRGIPEYDFAFNRALVYLEEIKTDEFEQFDELNDEEAQALIGQIFKNWTKDV